MLGAFLLSLARGSWFGFMATLAILVWSGKLCRNRLVLSGIAILCVAVVGLGSISGLDFFGRLTSVKNFGNDPAMVPRFLRWEYFFERSLEKPLFGFGTVADPTAIAFFGNDAVSTHNTYLSIAVRRGYIALALMLVVIIKTLSMSRAVFHRATDPFERAVGLGIYSGLFGLCVVSAFLDAFLEDTQVNVVFWLLVAVTARMYRNLPAGQHAAARATQHGSLP